MSKAALHLALTMFGLMALPPVTANERPDRSRSKEPGIQLTSEHMEASIDNDESSFKTMSCAATCPLRWSELAPANWRKRLLITWPDSMRSPTRSTVCGMSGARATSRPGRARCCLLHQAISRNGGRRASIPCGCCAMNVASVVGRCSSPTGSTDPTTSIFRSRERSHCRR